MATGCIRRIICSIAVLCAVVLLMHAPVSADASYGRGVYGKCPSGRACPVTVSPPTTVVTLDNGLKVIENLKDGQKIPRGGYAITVTPANSQGPAIDHVDIYIDDQLAATVLPSASTGAVRWVWDNLQLPGSIVKLVVTAKDGQSVTNNYHIQIVDAVNVPAVTDNTPSTSLPQTYLKNATQFVGQLPKPVIKTFPYILFLILLGNLVLLGVQLYHEVREYGVARRLLDRARQVADDKRILVELISHYLRTPVTLLGGGVEMLKVQPARANLEQLLRSLTEKVERLIAQTRDTSAAADTLPVVSGEQPKLRFWRHPMLSLPIILIGLVVLLFDYLAHRADALNVSQTNFLIQVLLFCTLAVLTYLVFRYVHLRRRDARELARVTQAEAAVAQARDNLVSETAHLLQQDTNQLGAMAAALPKDDASGFVVESHRRLAALLQKVQLAAGLRFAHSAGPLTMVPLDQLLQQAAAEVSKKAAERHIVLPGGNTAPVPSRNPELLRTVVASLLDNAVAYSPDNARVEVSYRADRQAVELTVADHGGGIAADKLRDLFLPFQKLEGVDTFNHEGMGFSLYLDRLIMTYLGGSISADSNPNEGTRVTLQLPLAADAAAVAQA